MKHKKWGLGGRGNAAPLWGCPRGVLQVPGIGDLPGADLVSSTAGLCTRVAGDYRALGFWISVLTPVCHHGESCRLCHCLYCFFHPSGDARTVQNQNLKLLFSLKKN